MKLAHHTVHEKFLRTALNSIPQKKVKQAIQNREIFSFDYNKICQVKPLNVSLSAVIFRPVNLTAEIPLTFYESSDVRFSFDSPDKGFISRIRIRYCKVLNFFHGGIFVDFVFYSSPRKIIPTKKKQDQ